MKERPILFSTPMVQAIMEGRKTMTRRILKKQEQGESFKNCSSHLANGFLYSNGVAISNQWKCPYGKPGDRLWVKETSCFVMLDHAHDLLEGMKSQTVYKASVHHDWMDYAKEKYGYKWTPSIFMPRSASRITLEITNIRVERLNEITKEDAIKEGIIPFQSNAQYGEEIMFEILWKGINGKGSWDANPWVWVIEFERIKP